eukprot:364508-Chlamydomonas_euryale.AAC.10
MVQQVTKLATAAVVGALAVAVGAAVGAYLPKNADGSGRRPGDVAGDKVVSDALPAGLPTPTSTRVGHTENRLSTACPHPLATPPTVAGAAALRRRHSTNARQPQPTRV